MGYVLGVDLGTTYTAAAVRVDDRVRIVRLGSRRAEIPSLVFQRADGEVLVGDAAERRGVPEPSRLAREFKRRLGDPVPVLVGGTPWSAHALTGRLLAHVYEDVVHRQEGPPSEVVVAHPANWGPYKRELLTQAVTMAGVPDARLVAEPVAAAVQYAAQQRMQPGETVAVYDLGGGTFDAAVLRRTATGFELLGDPAGVEALGGADFDDAVLAHVAETLGPVMHDLDTGDPAIQAALAQLRRDCVLAKEDLSHDTDVLVPVALPSVHTRVRLNRSEFEAMIAPVLAETVSALRRALRSAGVEPAGLRSILLSGGSARIPLVGEMLTAEFGRPVVLDADPEHSVALGAALAADGEGTGPRAAAVTSVPMPAEPPAAGSAGAGPGASDAGRGSTYGTRRPVGSHPVVAPLPGGSHAVVTPPPAGLRPVRIPDRAEPSAPRSAAAAPAPLPASSRPPLPASSLSPLPASVLSPGPASVPSPGPASAGPPDAAPGAVSPAGPPIDRTIPRLPDPPTIATPFAAPRPPVTSPRPSVPPPAPDTAPPPAPAPAPAPAAEAAAPRANAAPLRLPDAAPRPELDSPQLFPAAPRAHDGTAWPDDAPPPQRAHGGPVRPEGAAMPRTTSFADLPALGRASTADAVPAVPAVPEPDMDPPRSRRRMVLAVLAALLVLVLVAVAGWAFERSRGRDAGAAVPGPVSGYVDGPPGNR